MKLTLSTRKECAAIVGHYAYIYRCACRTVKCYQVNHLNNRNTLCVCSVMPTRLAYEQNRAEQKAH